MQWLFNTFFGASGPELHAPSGGARLSFLSRGLLLGAAAALVACGGGGTGGGDPGAPPAPGAMSLSSTTIKTFEFKWSVVEGATHYQLYEDLDGDGSQAAVALKPSTGNILGSDAQITGTSFKHEVPLFDRLNARYTLKACNDLGCSADSPAFSFTPAQLNAAIGYAKASDPEASDGFGAAIALSRDGTTLAVGAPFKDVAGLLNVGTAYVMRRSAAGAWSAPVRVDSWGTNHAGERFGVSLALSANGSVLAVGAPFDDANGVAQAGSVQMFIRNETNGVYAFANKLTADNAQAGDFFGGSVALSDDGHVLAVGAKDEDGAAGADITDADTGADDNSGAVYVFRRSGDADPSWNEQLQYIKASNAQTQDAFGVSVALSGNGQVLAIGASDRNSGAGVVYVYTVDGAGLFGDEVLLDASNPGSGDKFGHAVTLSHEGNVLAVGAISESSASTGVNGPQDNDNASGSGAVYVFEHQGSWAQTAYLKASNTAASAAFGVSIAMSSSGDTLAVASPGERGSGRGLGSDPTQMVADNKEDGAVYLFKRNTSSGAWAQSAYVKAPNRIDGDFRSFGSGLALSGDGATLAVSDSTEGSNVSTGWSVGAHEDNAQLSLSGAVYLF